MGSNKFDANTSESQAITKLQRGNEQLRQTVQTLSRPNSVNRYRVIDGPLRGTG